MSIKELFTKTFRIIKEKDLGLHLLVLPESGLFNVANSYHIMFAIKCRIIQNEQFCSAVSES